MLKEEAQPLMLKTIWIFLKNAIRNSPNLLQLTLSIRNRIPLISRNICNFDISSSYSLEFRLSSILRNNLGICVVLVVVFGFTEKFVKRAENTLFECIVFWFHRKLNVFKECFTLMYVVTVRWRWCAPRGFPEGKY